MKRLLILCLLASPAWAAVDGVVTNQTIAKPQADVVVTLIKLGSGMEAAGTARTDAKGHFAIPGELEKGLPYLLQAAFQKVNYNLAIRPGASAQGLEIAVYNTSLKPGEAKVTQHMVLVQPGADALTINEVVVFQNRGRETFDDPEKGTLRVYLPDNLKGPVDVDVKGPQGMPIRRQAIKTNQPNVYKIEFPVKPGETQFEFSYAVPPSDSFEGRVLHGGGPIRLVSPKGVTLSGANVVSTGTEPRSQANIYEVKAASYKISIESAGAPPTAAAEAPPEDQSPPIKEAKPRIYQQLYPLLALAATILALGFAILYRAGSGSVSSAKQK